MYQLNGLGTLGRLAMREAPSWTAAKEGLTTDDEIDAARERLREEYAQKRAAWEAGQTSNTVLYLGIGAAVLAVLGAGYLMLRNR